MTAQIIHPTTVEERFAIMGAAFDGDFQATIKGSQWNPSGVVLAAERRLWGGARAGIPSVRSVRMVGGQINGQSL